MSARVAGRFRPQLEQFEAREVPAALTWTDGIGDHSFYTQGNWKLTDTGASTSLTPMLGDDATFDGASSSDNCVDLGLLEARPNGGGPLGEEGGGSPGVYPGLNSLRLINGYAGTVSLVAPVQAGTFVLSAAAAGAIAQTASTAGSDLTVTNSFTWTSGTLNSSTHLATVTLNGATGLIAPTSGGTLSFGSNLAFENEADVTVKEGTIDPNKDGVEISTSTGASLNFSPDTLTSILLGALRELNGTIGSGTPMDSQSRHFGLSQGQIVE